MGDEVFCKWSVERLKKNLPIVISIDHGFYFPLRHVEVHHQDPYWKIFPDKLGDAINPDRQS
jgi:hypothetical protein